MLPERPFQNPVARALMAIRRDLSLRPNDRASAVNGLDALLMAPDALGADYGAYTTWRHLLPAWSEKSPAAIDEAQQRMWELALHLEEGQTERTARALDEARQAARDALDKAIREPNDANREALDRRLKELEEAIERHMQALAEEARRNNDEMPFDPNAQHLSNRDLDKMAEQAREAAREGRMQDAQQRMAELERMLDRLRNARAEHGRDGERTEAQRQRGRQQMGAVQDMIGRQGSLLDHSQGRADETTRFRGNRPPTAAADENAAARGGPAGAAGAAPRARRADAAVRRPDRPGAAEPGRGRHRDARGRTPARRGQRCRRRRRPSRRRSRRCRRAAARWARRWPSSSARRVARTAASRTAMATARWG